VAVYLVVCAIGPDLWPNRRAAVGQTLDTDAPGVFCPDARRTRALVESGHLTPLSDARDGGSDEKTDTDNRAGQARRLSAPEPGWGAPGERGGRER